MIITFSTKAEIYKKLKTDIITGEYDFGEKINIDAVCRKYSVSNSPVREALALLQNDHLVNIKPNSGAFITDMNDEIYNRLSETIKMLLLGSYQICLKTGKIGRLTERMIHARDSLKRCIETGDTIECIKALLLFDRCFLVATENDFSISIFDNFFDFLLLSYLYNHRERTIDWSYNIIKCDDMIKNISAGDCERVQGSICEKYILHLH